MSTIAGLPHSDEVDPATAPRVAVPGAANSALSAVIAPLEAMAAALEGPALVSVDLPLSLLPPSFGDPTILRGAAGVLWERPTEGVLLAGFGQAALRRGERSSSLSDCSSAVREALATIATQVTSPARPRAFVGARFAPAGKAADPVWDSFGGWQCVVPQVLVAVCDGEAGASLTLALQPGEASSVAAAVEDALARLADLPAGVPQALPPAPAAIPGGWESAVATALDEIRAGRYQKVVLARPADEALLAPIDQGAVLTRLAERYPHCFIFAFRTSEAAWLGATPELLASLDGDTVLAASLAGSKPRGANATADARLAADLLGSAKERAEHAVVALAIQEALSPLCTSLSAPDAPSLLRLSNIQHLHTPVTGQLRPGIDLLDVVAALHPTPAVGGWPRPGALDALDRLEAMDRGWYAGPIGWVDAAGDGEFAVGLRSALVAGSAARLYAGAGIVLGSEPSVEYAETEAKLRPLREALGVD